MSLAPLELLSAHPWQRVVFTTYALSLSFVEAVILDALLRGGSSQALILSDVQGVRDSLGELGAQRVGKDYEVEPVAVDGGVFHPKISVLCSPDECHVLVGSGNLTFNGWGGSCEVLEHLHPTFAADAILDLAGFFDLMAAGGRTRHRAESNCRAVASDLRRAAQGRPRTGNIKLLHSLGVSISEQIVQLAADLGGAKQIVAAAPFWDDGAAIDQLCTSLGLDRVLVHSHPSGSVGAGGISNWPRCSRLKVHAVQLDILAQESRNLHAKMFEILCRRGRIVISGSANGSRAALARDHNVEVCVARIERERMIGWSFRPASPPEPPTETDEDDLPEVSISGVLRATLEADELAGTVLTPRMTGMITVQYLAGTGLRNIGHTALDSEGGFRIAARNLEELSWRGGRLVIRIQDQRGRQAEGFVSVASFGDITRRTGLLGRRLFALLAGTETPADVAAIMTWIHEDPRRLTMAGPKTIRGEPDSKEIDDADSLVAVATLGSADPPEVAGSHSHGTVAERRWSRFIDQVFAAFRQTRGPFGRAAAGRLEDDEDEDETDDANAHESGDDPAITRTFETFDKLFAMLLEDGTPTRNALAAFDLTRYLCDRLRPETTVARGWLDRLIRALLKLDVPPERRPEVAASVLALLGMSPEPKSYRWARECLLQLNLDFMGGVPSEDGARGFLSVLPQHASFSELWSELSNTRSYSEQVSAYVQALKRGMPSLDYPDLPKAAQKEWPTLERAITSERVRKNIALGPRGSECCPECDITLPPEEIYKLQSVGIATAKNCCGKLVILEEA